MTPYTLNITPEEAGSLAGLFKRRVELTPDKEAYRQYDPSTERWESYSWAQMRDDVARYQAALQTHALQAGDRTAIMMNNRREWVLADQASLGLGLVNVPIFYNDRAQNAQYVLQHSGSKLLFIAGNEQWNGLRELIDDIPTLEQIISIEPIEDPHPKLQHIDHWLARGDDRPNEHQVIDLPPQSLATICYTSGTTGYPKGVMLSHQNILSNGCAALKCGPLNESSTLLSFLPLSHMFERTAGYYMAMTNGATVVYAQSVQTLGDDLQSVRPTHLIAVPRIFERVYGKIMDGLKEKSPIARKLFQLANEIGWRQFQYQQQRASWHPSLLLNPLLHKLVGAKVMAKLGGRLQLAISGGAPLPEHVAKLFLSLGLPVIEGFGMTEHSPVISANRLDSNIPGSVGHALEGVEVQLGENNELLARSDAVMLGYWDNPEATAATIDEQGWLHTGDQASIDDSGRVRITGRIKEIIVLANGEKVPPSDIEQAIGETGLIEQALVVGEGKPFLALLAVPSPEAWPDFLADCCDDPSAPTADDIENALQVLQERIDHCMAAFPGYAKIRKICLSPEAWTIENGLMTPTLKLKRARIIEKYRSLIETMYKKS